MWTKILMSKQDTQIHPSSQCIASTIILLTSNRKFLSNNKRLPCKTTRTTALCWETVQVSNNQRFHLQSVKELMSNLNLESKIHLTPKSILVLNKRYSVEYKLKLHITRVTNSKEHLNLQILWIKVAKSTIVTGNSQLWFQTRSILTLSHSTSTTKVTTSFQLNKKTRATCSVRGTRHKLVAVIRAGLICKSDLNASHSKIKEV